MIPETESKELTFDEWLPVLKVKLPPLGYRRSLAFAASCCERSLPNYTVFASEAHWGEPQVLAEALDLTWRLAQVRKPEELHSLAKALLKAVGKITPDTEGSFDSLLTSAALDAAASITETLGYALDQNTNHIVSVASLARDTIYLYVQYTENASHGDRGFDKRIGNHPLMTAELAKQQLDMKTLEIAHNPPPDFWASFRRGATIAGKSNLGICP